MEHTNPIKDKNLAKKISKGAIYCCTTIINADGEYKEEEFNSLINLSEKNDLIKTFYDRDSLKNAFMEGLNILKTDGIDELLRRVEFTFRDVDKNIRSHIFFSCLHIACSDRSIANKEILALQKVYRMLNLDIDSVFMLTLLFFQSELANKTKPVEPDKTGNKA